MFISRKHYDDLRIDAAKHAEEARVFAAQNSILHHTVQELCQRLTMSEHERILLLKNYMGITLPQPEFVPSPSIARTTPTAAEVDVNIPALLGSGGIFNDVGDEAAKKLGIAWDTTGAVVAK